VTLRVLSRPGRISQAGHVMTIVRNVAGPGAADEVGRIRLLKDKKSEQEAREPYPSPWHHGRGQPQPPVKGEACAWLLATRAAGAAGGAACQLPAQADTRTARALARRYCRLPARAVGWQRRSPGACQFWLAEGVRVRVTAY